VQYLAMSVLKWMGQHRFVTVSWTAPAPSFLRMSAVGYRMIQRSIQLHAMVVHWHFAARSLSLLTVAPLVLGASDLVVPTPWNAKVLPSTANLQLPNYVDHGVSCVRSAAFHAGWYRQALPCKPSPGVYALVGSVHVACMLEVRFDGCEM
jgi:hypothetical protein